MKKAQKPAPGYLGKYDEEEGVNVKEVHRPLAQGMDMGPCPFARKAQVVAEC